MIALPARCRTLRLTPQKERAMSISNSLPAEGPAAAQPDVDEEAVARPEEASTERPLEQLEIEMREDHYSISELARKIAANKLILQPDFQRHEVWSKEKRSRFIESILLNYPLPALYLNQQRDGKYLVIDGLQRTSSISRFMKDEFALTGLETLPWLNQRKFSELDFAMRSRIEDKQMTCFVLKPSVPFWVIYDIFSRINQGGVILKQHEIRNALYQGDGVKLLRRLATSVPFGDWIGYLLNPIRMGDEEAVLRCIAFARLEPSQSYGGDLDSFLNESLRQLNEPKAAPEREQIEGQFPRIFAKARRIFGKDAFRVPTERTRGRLNLAVMDSIYRFLSRKTDAWFEKNQEQLAANYTDLLKNAEYREVVRFATGTRSRVQARIALAQSTLGAGCVD